MASKALPADRSDHSLPGRLEEGGNAHLYGDAPSVPRRRDHALVIGMFLFLIVGAGFLLYYFANQDDIDSEILESTIPNSPGQLPLSELGIGEYGSAHAHAAIAVFIGKSQIDFGAAQFQLQNKYIHFEDFNPYMIHKHATGVSLGMLFASIGMDITQECITVNLDRRFCTSGANSMTFLVNGNVHQYISAYEIQHGDRILISFGDESDIGWQWDYISSVEIYEVPRQERPGSDRDQSV